MSVHSDLIDTILLYGGSFDPPHNGHVESVRYAIQKYPNSKILVTPGIRPAIASGHHKNPVATFDDRMEMCRLAFCDLSKDRIEISDIEAGIVPPVYTLKTLERLRIQYPQMRLMVMMGQDQLRNFPQWFEPKRILAMAGLLVVKRSYNAASSVPSSKLASDAEKVAMLLALTLRWDDADTSATVEDLASKIDLLDIQLPAAESSQIRRQLPNPQNDEVSWLPEAVKRYISEKNLYANTNVEPK